MEECKDAPILSREQMLNSYSSSYLLILVFHVLIQDLTVILKADPSNPEISPLLYQSLANLAPAYIQVCGLDPCRDEALVYEELLRENGVLTRLDRFVTI